MARSTDESKDHGASKDHGGLTHIDERGRARMVDVMAKPLTRRVAVAKCAVVTEVDVADGFEASPEGIDIIEAARFAGILAAKGTASLIPLCHPIRIHAVRVEVEAQARRFEISATTEIIERTGVEMEALTACAMAALTLVKALVDVDPTAHIEGLTVWHKSGGRSGNWERKGPGHEVRHLPSP
jgi:cyclic pyranopterin phosphate synthase